MLEKSIEKARILIADSSSEDAENLRILLNIGGYFDLIFASETTDVLSLLGVYNPKSYIAKFDLVLIDIFMDNSDGIRVLKTIKSMEHMKDTPFIVVTNNTNLQDMLSSFEVGATDYVMKPIYNRIELIARINSALQLKMEMDIRKAREQELLIITKLLDESNKKLRQANATLETLAFYDALTAIANRRYFDKYLSSEWSRAQRNVSPISIVMMDIDFFKLYNDTYGHQRGDECLKCFAEALKEDLKKPGDLVPAMAEKNLLHSCRILKLPVPLSLLSNYGKGWTNLRFLMINRLSADI